MLLAAGLLVAAVGVLAFNLPRHGAAPERLAGSQAQKSPLRLRLGSRPSPGSCSRSAGPQSCHATPSYAGTWSAQASRPRTCWPLGPGSNDPLGSALVVATGPIRAHFGTRLASVYAPAVIASFGSRTARIDIRLVYPGGAASVRRR